jgi:purine-binding chemotaxis protein CheW
VADLVRLSPGRLARPLRSESEELAEFLAFTLAGDLYGIELTRVREILSSPPLTWVPRASPDVLGVCSVRGLLVTVIDLRRRLGLKQAPATRRARILLTQTSWGEVMGLFVDEVRQVVRFPSSGIEVAATVLGGDISEYVMGIARPGGTLIILLDLPSIVAA